MKILVFLAALALAATQCNSPEGSSTTAQSTQTATDRATQPTHKETYRMEEYVAAHPELNEYAVATFAGGCFWCTEAVFERIRGVKDVISAYAGGGDVQPIYGRQMGKGPSGLGHAEAIQIWYDPAVVDYKTLLDVFFVAHDPTQLNRQGPDQGPEYRSEIWYHDEAQLTAIENAIETWNANHDSSDPVVTRVSPYAGAWVAEGYHQNYFERPPYSNPGYVANVTRPKVEKAVKTFPDLIKEEYRNEFK